MKGLPLLGRALLAVLTTVGLSLVAGATAGAKPASANVFLSPTGSDGAKCIQAAPCHSLQRGYRVARPGDIVELAGGDYGEQGLSPDARKAGGKVVTFTRGSSGRPSFESLEIDGGVTGVVLAGLHFADGLDVGKGGEGPPARNITLRNTTGARFKIMNAQAVSVLGGSYGPSVDNPSQIKVYNPDDKAMPRDIRIEGVRFHDYTRTADDVHTECLQVYAGERISLRRNRFTNCSGTGSLGLTTLSSTRLKDIVVENNWFDETGDAFYAVQADVSVENLIFRYNSSLKGLIFTECTKTPCGSALVVGNYMPWNHSLCVSTTRYAHNVLLGGKCDKTDTQVSRLDFVDAKGFNLHLKPAANAICRGDWKNFPLRDLDGQLRQQAFRPDAGADQLSKRAGDKSVPRRCSVKSG